MDSDITVSSITSEPSMSVDIISVTSLRSLSARSTASLLRCTCAFLMVLFSSGGSSEITFFAIVLTMGAYWIPARVLVWGLVRAFFCAAFLAVTVNLIISLMSVTK